MHIIHTLGSELSVLCARVVSCMINESLFFVIRWFYVCVFVLCLGLRTMQKVPTGARAHERLCKCT